MRAALQIYLSRYSCDDDGAVTVEAALLSFIMLLATIMAFEVGYGFSQWNKAEQAARIGARIAATSDPVSRDLTVMTGLGNGVNSGDPFPDYIRSCFGANQSCSQGQYDSSAMARIFYGPDNDGVCGATARARRGICDIYGALDINNIRVSYENSGMGRAGSPADPAPLITVTITGAQFSFALLDLIAPQSLKTMPDVSVTLLAEDLKTGA